MKRIKLMPDYGCSPVWAAQVRRRRETSTSETMPVSHVLVAIALRILRSRDLRRDTEHEDPRNSQALDHRLADLSKFDRADGRCRL